MYAIFLSFFLAKYVNATCTAAGPISLPITDVPLSNNKVMRGIPMTIGSPPQNISVMPHQFLNDTWLYNATDGWCTADLGGTSQNFCTTYRGGLYDPKASTSCDPVSSVYESGGDPSDTQRALGIHVWSSAWATDILSLQDISLPKFPIGMPGWDFTGNFETQNSIGMGLNSTLLSTLKAAGKISARSWSWWWGQTGATEDVQMDGSIVFGGYDKAKTFGEQYTQPIVPSAIGCSSDLPVRMTALVLNFPNGTQSNILKPAQLSTCLQPDYATFLSLPESPYFQNFEMDTQTRSLGRDGGRGLAARGQIYPPDEVFQGSMTVTLEGDFSVEIPNSLLVVPPREVAPEGGISTNDSYSALLINPTTDVNADDWAILGRIFFSVAYLHVDHDNGTFSLWQANPTDEQDLRANNEDCPDPEQVSSSNGTIASEPPHQADSDSSPKGTSDSHIGLSTGAMVGIIIGSIALIALISALTIILCIRKRKYNRTSSKEQMVSGTAGEANFVHGHSIPGSQGAWPASRAHPHQKYHEAFSSDVVEMNAETNPLEVVGRERPAELSGPSRKSRRYRQYIAANESPVEIG